MIAASIKRGWHFDKDTLPAHLGWEELPSENELYEHLLDIDIKEFGSPVLVDIPPASTNIPKDVVLQVRRVKNVCVPESSWKSGTFESSKNDVLRYYLTDGHSSISAYDMNSNFRLKKGTKVLFAKDCPIDCGFIVMDKKYLTVYGGGILDDDEQKPMKAGGEESAIARQAPKFAELLNPKKAAKAKMAYKLPPIPSDNDNTTFGRVVQEELNVISVPSGQINAFNEDSKARGRNDRGPRQSETVERKQDKAFSGTVQQGDSTSTEYGTSNKSNSRRGGRNERGTAQRDNFDRKQDRSFGGTFQQEDFTNTEYCSSKRGGQQRRTNDREARQRDFGRNNDADFGGGFQQERNYQTAQFGQRDTFNNDPSKGNRYERGPSQRGNFGGAQNASFGGVFQQEKEFSMSQFGQRNSYNEVPNQRNRNDRGQRDTFGGNHEYSRPSTVPENNSTKGRGNFQFDSYAGQPQKYDDYEYNITPNLTFSKTSGSSGAPQPRGDSSRNFERRETQSSQSDRNRYQQREQGNSYSNFDSDEVQSGRGNRGRGGRGSGRGRGGTRGGGRGQSNPGVYGQGSRDARYQTYTNYSIPAGPQFNAASDFDFPALGDSMSGMSLR